MKWFKTVSIFCKGVAIAALTTTQIAIATESLKTGSAPTNFEERLKKIYADKNRQLPIMSTSDTKKSDAKPKSNAPSPSTQEVAMGGISDGGGNAVGATFFDFYENEGSLPISLEELLYLQPTVKPIIDHLNKQVPAVKYVDSGTFGDLLLQSLKPKKIYLETKPITSKACLNESLVSTEQQMIVACQSDIELRLNVQWLRSTDDKNRAGLMVHELLLAWARVETPKDEKTSLEEKIRQLNREIFTSLSEPIDIAKSIMSIFNVRAYDERTFALGKALPTKIIEATKAFCKNPLVNPFLAFSDYTNDRLLFQDLPHFLFVLQSLSHEASSVSTFMGSDSEIKAMRRNTICKGALIDSQPIRPPRVGLLPQPCLKNLDEHVLPALKYKNQFLPVAPPADRRFLVGDQRDEVLRAASMCMLKKNVELVERQIHLSQDENNKMMSVVFAEVYMYVRWKLQQEGIEVSFIPVK